MEESRREGTVKWYFTPREYPDICDRSIGHHFNPNRRHTRNKMSAKAYNTKLVFDVRST